MGGRKIPGSIKDSKPNTVSQLQYHNLVFLFPQKYLDLMLSGSGS